MISVILPTYNRAGMLQEAIASVLGQTFTDLELIIADDGSTDETAEVISNYKDKRVIYLPLERGGANAARNAGIRRASFDIVAFQDSDAWWEPDKLAVAQTLLSSLPADYAGVFSAFLVENSRGRKYRVPRNRIKESELYGQLLYENFIDTPALLLRKAALVDVGMFKEDLPRFQDWELALRLSRSYRLHFLDRVLHVSLYSSGSISEDNTAGLKAKIYIFRKHERAIRGNNKILANHFYSLGLSFANLKRMIMAKRFFLKALSINLGHLKAWFRLVQTILPSYAKNKAF